MRCGSTNSSLSRLPMQTRPALRWKIIVGCVSFVKVQEPHCEGADFAHRRVTTVVVPCCCPSRVARYLKVSISTTTTGERSSCLGNPLPTFWVDPFRYFCDSLQSSVSIHREPYFESAPRVFAGRIPHTRVRVSRLRRYPQRGTVCRTRTAG